MIDPFAPENSGERRSTAPVFALERRERILAQLRDAGSVKVSELAVALGVSELTVRRDVGALADLGLLSRVHGGAVERSPLDTTSPRAIPGPVPPRYRIGAVVPSLRSGCTALLVHSDRHALLIQQRAADLGWDMPDALALIAYDDELAASGHPPITALGPPKQQLGRAAVELIVARLREPGKPKQRIDLLPDLRVRESSR